MNWNNHYELTGKHAFLSPSKYHWINYDEDRLRTAYSNSLAVQRGTDLHALASEHIRLQVNMPKTNRTLDRFVNDALGFRMRSEQPLKYSDNAFGTADAISFRKNVLRIHDLKTGVTPAHMEQLIIYAALFCLEYTIKPETIKIELRIYQNDEIQIYNPEPEEILQVMKTTIEDDKIIQEMKEAANA